MKVNLCVCEREKERKREREKERKREREKERKREREKERKRERERLNVIILLACMIQSMIIKYLSVQCSSLGRLFNIIIQIADSRLAYLKIIITSSKNKAIIISTVSRSFESFFRDNFSILLIFLDYFKTIFGFLVSGFLTF